MISLVKQVIQIFSFEQLTFFSQYLFYTCHFSSLRSLYQEALEKPFDQGYLVYWDAEIKDVHGSTCKQRKQLDHYFYISSCAWSVTARSECSLLEISAKLGANAILGVSLAVCKAGAAHKVELQINK